MFNLTDNALRVLQERYLRPDETPTGMLQRVAAHVASCETDEDRPDITESFYRLMADGLFLPNSPTLSGSLDADGKGLGQLSACFVLPIEDSIESIMETAKQAALIHKSGGGTGFSFGRLRPLGAPVSTTGGVAGGPVSWLKLYNSVSGSIAQGSIRHGANMGILPVNHPDIERFVTCKTADPDSIRNFNISVGADERWMGAALNDKGSPEDKLLELIAQNAHATGDPGMVWLDRMNASASNPVPSLGPIEATNPCGEQPLYPYDVCTLGSINLAAFFIEDRDGYDVGAENRIDWQRLAFATKLAIRFLDNVVSVNRYPLPQVEGVAHGIRRIGLGVMGWADLLALLRVPYSSEEALALATLVSERIRTWADQASLYLGEKKGPFPFWSESRDGLRYRNCTRTTIAPTGTISIIAGCSSGIEPHFGLVFERRHHLDHENPDQVTRLFEINPIFHRWVKTLTPGQQAEVLKAVTKGARPLSTPVPEYFQLAHDISPEWHIRHQAAWQANTDNAVSKTINLPHSASVADVRAAYEMAWRMGCKGVTVYRDGCRSEQVLVHSGATTTKRRKLPKTRPSLTHHFQIDGLNGYLTVGLFEDGTPGELFIRMDHQAGMVNHLTDAVCIGVSLGLQNGIPFDVFARKYIGSRFAPAGVTGDPDVPKASSILDYIFRWVEQRFYSDTPSSRPVGPTGDECPLCGGLLRHEEGCAKCECGYSEC